MVCMIAITQTILRHNVS